MRLLSLVSLSLALFVCATTTLASPPSWPPSDVTTSITAECAGLKGSITYSQDLTAESDWQIKLEQVSVTGSIEDVAKTLPMQTLPKEVSEIHQPFVQRVIPTCSDNGMSFTFYIAARKDVSLPRYESRGKVTRLYVDITDNNELSLYSLPAPSASSSLATETDFEGQFTALPVFRMIPERGLMQTIVADRVVSREINDCSDAEFFCLKGPELKLLWDRKREVRRAVGNEFSSEELTTRVVGTFDRRIHHSGVYARHHVLMVKGQSDLAYFVNGRCELYGVLADTSGEARLVSFFAETTSFQVSDIDGAELAGVVYSPILSNKRIGGCE